MGCPRHAVCPVLSGLARPHPEEFASFVRLLYNFENGHLPGAFCSTSSYFALDETDRLAGTARLGHYLTVAGMDAYGHIGYVVRPSERGKGYATQMVALCLEEARARRMDRVLLDVHATNAASCRVIEKSGGIWENDVPDPVDAAETIRRYWIRL